MIKQRPPLPHIVRAKRKCYNLLMQSYNARKESGIFNRSGRGTVAYYERAIAKYTAYFERWGHLENVRLSTQPENSFQRNAKN